MLKPLRLIFFVIVFTLAVISAEKNKISNDYGFYGNSNLNFANTNIRGIEGFQNCCTPFGIGFGLGLNVGAAFKSYYKNGSYLLFKAGYMINNISFFSDRRLPVSIFDNGKETIENAEIEYFLKTTEHDGLASISYGYPVFDIFEFQFGYTISFATLSQFQQSERLISPQSGVFSSTKTREQNVYNADFTRNNLSHYINLGISRAIPLNSKRDLIIAPEVNLLFGLNDRLSYGSFRSYIISGGFSIFYRIYKDEDTPLLPSE
jgi:hypothetical protein